MDERIKISLPIVVEGKYDKSALTSLFDATVITVGGFSIFNSKEKQALLRKVAKNGIIILTDADGAGKVIRSFLNGIIPKEKIYNLYIPKIEGKEKRKSTPSKEGLLGVEGIGKQELLRVLSPFMSNDAAARKSHGKTTQMITKVDFYTDKLTGFENSSFRRDELAARFGLPSGMTPNALLEALNIVTDRDEYRLAVDEIFQ